MGTDTAPVAEVAGAVQAMHDLGPECEIILVGDREPLEAELEKHGLVPDSRLSIHHAPDRVAASDAAATVLRRMPLSSIVVGLRLQKQGHADAFVSGGNTGAVMATSLLTLRPLPGVDRPAIGALLPTSKLPCLLLDAGANVDCKPHHLVQFAHLGNVYAEDIMGRDKPRVALLNIGEEAEKGNELSVEAHRLLSRAPGIRFVGNVEGRDIIQGVCDVVVADGFVGNVLLKFYESVAQFIIGLLRNNKGLSMDGPDLERDFRVLDYSEYGGAPLLGVGGVSIICHGQSSPKAIRNALGVAARAVGSGMVGHITTELGAPKTEGGS
jgi:glycerol-3-phosphate acyltransferase PlsX